MRITLVALPVHVTGSTTELLACAAAGFGQAVAGDQWGSFKACQGSLSQVVPTIACLPTPHHICLGEHSQTPSRDAADRGQT